MIRRAASLQSKYASAQLVVFSTALSFAMGQGQINYVVVSFLLLGCVVFVLTMHLASRFELPIYGVLFSVLGSALINFESFRASTVAYLALFLFAFAGYQRLLRHGALTLQQYRATLKFILFAYCIVLLAQQISWLLGLPIPNKILTELDNSKLNALAPEPSHAAALLCFAMLSYLRTSGVVAKRLTTTVRRDKLLWASFIYTMVTIRSGLAVILLIILVASYSSRRDILMIAIAIATAIILFILSNFNGIAFERAGRFVGALAQANPDALVVADHSASLRVLPTYYYIAFANPLDWSFWFGYGTDYNAKFFPSLIPGVEEDVGVGGAIPSHLLNYGILSGVTLWILLARYCIPRSAKLEPILLVILLSTSSVNTQLFWACALFLSSNKFFMGQGTRVAAQSMATRDAVIWPLTTTVQSGSLTPDGGNGSKV